jgi:Spy/CpxP family protein refolding chaperone
MRPPTPTRWFVAAALLVGLSASGARAQLADLENTTPQQRAQELTGIMKKELGLTPEQLSKVEALNLKYATKMEPVIKGSEGPFRKMRQAREINEEKEAELQKLLTPEQFDKYKAERQMMREKFEQRIEKKMDGGM